MKTAKELEQFILDNIPLSRAMSLQVSDFTLQPPSLTLTCPLTPNSNDKGTGFAGSIVSCATLAGWGLTSLLAAHNNVDATVVIASSNIDYLKPITDDFQVVATLAAEESVERFNQGLDSKGKSRLKVHINVMQGEVLAASQFGLYAARKKPV
ncbi:YiiD C-terminal domain-containing protein [Endozoicomonadaceae bacterium StTr2]